MKNVLKLDIKDFSLNKILMSFNFIPFLLLFFILKNVDILFMVSTIILFLENKWCLKWMLFNHFKIKL